MADVTLGILGLAGPVLTAVKRIIVLCDRVQNAPNNIRQLRAVTYRLQKNFDRIQGEASRISGSIRTSLPSEDQDEILQTLECCENFLKRHVPTLTHRGALGTLRRAAWFMDVKHCQELDGYRDRIDSIYIQIIHPFYLR